MTPRPQGVVRIGMPRSSERETSSPEQPEAWAPPPATTTGLLEPRMSSAASLTLPQSGLKRMGRSDGVYSVYEVGEVPTSKGTSRYTGPGLPFEATEKALRTAQAALSAEGSLNDHLVIGRNISI
jgi:hypothetical protein